jgi:hypothetical protein
MKIEKLGNIKVLTKEYEEISHFLNSINDKIKRGDYDFDSIVLKTTRFDSITNMKIEDEFNFNSRNRSIILNSIISSLNIVLKEIEKEIEEI